MENIIHNILILSLFLFLYYYYIWCLECVVHLQFPGMNYNVTSVETTNVKPLLLPFVGIFGVDLRQSPRAISALPTERLCSK